MHSFNVTLGFVISYWSNMAHILFLLKDDILKCMYIDMAGAFVTTYLFL